MGCPVAGAIVASPPLIREGDHGQEAENAGFASRVHRRIGRPGGRNPGLPPDRRCAAGGREGRHHPSRDRLRGLCRQPGPLRRHHGGRRPQQGGRHQGDGRRQARAAVGRQPVQGRGRRGRGREDERGGRRGLYRLLPEPGRHRRQPGRRQVQHAVPDRCRRLRPDREPRPQERVSPQARLRRLRRPGHLAARRAQQGRQRRRQDGGDRPRDRASSAPAPPSCSPASCRRSASRRRR